MILFVEEKGIFVEKKISKIKRKKIISKIKILYEQLHRVNEMVVQVKLGNYKKVDQKKN